MDFEIKFKGWHLFNIFAAAFFFCMSGLIIGYGLSDKETKVGLVIFGLVLLIPSIGMLYSVISTVTRSNCHIDIDSFTEAAINEAIEERWKKVREGVGKVEKIKVVA